MPLREKVGLGAALLLAVGGWFYMDHILVPFQVHDANFKSRPRGNLSDLYPRWLGARELLLRGRDPYSPEITREIQIGYYGRALDPTRPGDPEDQAAFAYPVYVVFLLAPTVTLPFSAVQKLFASALWVTTALSVILWLRALRWRPPASFVAALVALALGSLPVVQGIKLQQLTMLVAPMLAAAFAALAAGYLSLAGVFLALSTIKPQLALLPGVWVLAWSLCSWRERKRLPYAGAAVMAALLVGGEDILPGWVGRFRIAVENYHRYTHNLSLLQVLFSPTGGYVAAVVLLGITAWVCHGSLKAESNTLDFAASSALILALAVLTVPMFAFYNLVLLMPAVLLLVRWRRELWSGGGAGKMLLVVTGLALSWPWVASIAMDLALTVLPAAVVQSRWKLPFWMTFTAPLLVFASLAYHLAKKRSPSPASRCAQSDRQVR